jgi:hypothetical protein
MTKKQVTALSLTFIFTVHNAYAQTASTLVAPTAPDYSACSSTSGYDLCRQNADRKYQVDIANYTALKQQQDAIDAQRAAAAAAANAATKDAAQRAEDTTNAGKKKYGVENVVSLGISAFALYKAIKCGALPCNVPFYALSAMMAMNAMKAQQQAASAKSVQYQACTAANQVSTSQANCGAEPPAYTPPVNTAGLLNGGETYIPPNLFDSNGNCTGSQELCKQISDSLPPGATLRDVSGGLSAFASNKTPLKINPDGTIQNSKDGKKFDLSALNSEAGLVAAGLTPELAKGVLAELNKSKSGLDSDTAKSASGTGTVADAGLFDDASLAAARNAGGIGFGVNGEANSGALDADAANRTLASVSEGLVRDFNGETIGVQGENIFKMMKRRYLLKDKQDSFISGSPAAVPSP